MKWYIYGEVFFSTNAKRNAAGNRIDNYATRSGFAAEVWQQLIDTFGAWPAGRVNITSPTGSPGLRICYSTTSESDANEAFDDITRAWDKLQESDSWWAYAVTLT